MRKRLPTPTPALVISLVALFVALGGTSLAATSYIKGTHIKPHSIPKNRLTASAGSARADGATGGGGAEARAGGIGGRAAPGGAAGGAGAAAKAGTAPSAR